MKIKRLYVIGNGFDLHHGVNSTYYNFRKFVDKNSDLDELEVVEDSFSCSDLWSSFEENLAKFNCRKFATRIENDYRPNLMSDHYESTLSDARCEAENVLDEWDTAIRMNFPEWLKQLDRPSLIDAVFIKRSGSKFLTFNYTETLEHLYRVKGEDILHIHGKLGDRPSDLLLGHGGLAAQNKDFGVGLDPSDELAIADTERVARQYAARWEKPVRSNIQKHSAFFAALKNVKEVYVFGFSFSAIDMPYIEEVKASVNRSAMWTVSYYNRDEILKIRNSLNVDDSRLHLVKLDDLLLWKKYLWCLGMVLLSAFLLRVISII